VRIAVILLATLACAQGQTADDLLRRGDVLDGQNQNQEALVLFVEADTLRPDDAEILRRIAKQYDQLAVVATSPSEKKSLTGQALHHAKHAVAADPENARARLCLAIVYGRQAQFENPRRKVELSRLIKEEAEAAVALDPGQEYGWHILGRWNYELANFNPVLKTLAQTIYGKFPDATNEKAAEHFQKALALNPRSVLHHIELGRTLLALGRKTEARQALQAGLDLPAANPDDQEAQRRGRQALKKLR